MATGQPPARSVLRWLLPVVVGVLVLVATIALAVRQTTSIPDQRLDSTRLRLYLGVLLAVICFVGLLLFLVAAPSATKRPPKKKKTNFIGQLILMGVLVLVALWARNHNKNRPFQSPRSWLMGGGVSGTPSATPAPVTGGSGPVMVLLAVMGILVLIAGVVGVVIARRLARHDVELDLQPELPEDGLEAALGAALAATFSDDDPRHVVITCYETFERVLETRGVTRQANQTASTVLDRAMIRGLVDEDGVVASRDLIDVFERARFSPHEMVRADVERARAALDGIQASVSRCRAARADLDDETAEQAARR